MIDVNLREAETEVERIAERLGRPMSDEEVAFYDRLALRHDALLIARMPGILDHMTPSGALKRAHQNWEAIQTFEDHDRDARMAIVGVVAESALAVMLSR